MISVVNVVLVCFLLLSVCIGSIACRDIRTPTVVSASTNPADTKCGYNAGQDTAHQGTLVLLNVQNDRDKKSNMNQHGCNERDTIKISVDEPITVDVSTDHTVGNKALTEGNGNGDTAQGVSKVDKLDPMIKVYINGDITPEKHTRLGKTSSQNKIGSGHDAYHSIADIVKPDNRSGSKRQKRSPDWMHSYNRRHGRRTWKRYRDFWNWYSPYKNSFDPLASNIIG